MSAHPSLSITYRGRSQTLRWGDPRLEFGGRTAGLPLRAANSAAQPYIHGVCGWIECNGGWVLSRRGATSNISMTLTSASGDQLIKPGESVVLQPDDCRVTMILRGKKSLRETLLLELSMQVRPSSAPTPLPSTTEPIKSDDKHLGLLSPYEAKVMRVLALDQSSEPLTHRDIAAILGSPDEGEPVARAIERATYKARLEGLELPERRGVKRTTIVVRWLIANGHLDVVGLR